MKKPLSLLLTASMILALFAACSGGSADPASTPPAGDAASTESAASAAPSESVAPADPNAPIVLRYATGAADGLAAINDVAMQFSEAIPNATMETTVLPGGPAGYNAAMASKFAANDAPDLFTYQWGTQITAYARGGHLMDITDIGIGDTLKEIKKPVNVFQGRVYAYPVLQMLWGLMYNEKLGIDSGVTDIPKTVDQFTDAMDKIKANGVEYPFIVPAKDGSGATGFVFCYLHQIVSGQNPDFYYQTLIGEKNWNGPEWQGLFAMYDRLLQYASPDKLGLDPDNAYTRFARGEGAFLVTGPSTVRRIEEMNPDMAGNILYIPFPLYENEADYGTIADFDAGTSIWSKTKYPEQSIALLKLFLTSENSIAYATAMNGVSPVKGTPDTSVDPSIVNQLPLLEAGKYSGFSEREWVPGIKEIMKTNVQEWMAGTDVDTCLTKLEAEHKRLLDASPDFIDDFMEIRENTIS